MNPGEVETPILDLRAVPPTAEQRALMLQYVFFCAPFKPSGNPPRPRPEDVAAAVLMVASLPSRAHITDLVIKPTIQDIY